MSVGLVVGGALVFAGAWESMKETSEDNQREYAAEMLFLERDGEFGNATVFVCGPEDLGGE